MDNKIIAIDFDGVIANTDIAKLNFARNELGLEISEQFMKERYFIELFGDERGKALYWNIIKNIYISEQMLKVPMIPFSNEGITKLCEAGWICIIVTSRSGSINEIGSSAYWAWRFLQENNYEIERKNFINVNQKPKLDVCLALNSYGLVDDDYSKILPIINAGLKGYLFSSQTNNNVEKEFSKFQGIRVNDWNHLIKTITSL